MGNYKIMKNASASANQHSVILPSFLSKYINQNVEWG